MVLLTANERRHKHVAHCIARRLCLVGVVSEAKPPSSVERRGDGDAVVMSDHFAQWQRTENEFFHEANAFPSLPVHTFCVPRGGSNSAEVFQWIRQREPDALMLFGTSIIREPLLLAYPQRIVNLHLGLSPYYRGSGTNFWPLANNEPECVGFTIHLAEPKVDSGPILWQGRPRPATTDRAHQLGCKTIIEGGRIFADVTARYLSNQLDPDPQSPGGRVYRQCDFHAEAVRRMHRNFDGGMLTDFITSYSARCARFPIIGLPTK